MLSPVSLAVPKRQQGAALVFGLIFLVLLTILGMSAMSISTLEERMAGNTRDRSLAFQVAEAALRDCESTLQGASAPPFYSTANASGMYIPQTGQNWWEVISWTSANSRMYAGTALDGISSQPRCIVEELPYVVGAVGNQSLRAGQQQEETGMYRITSRAPGANATTVVMLQSIYRR